jgi:hypothetical protein
VVGGGAVTPPRVGPLLKFLLAGISIARVRSLKPTSTEGSPTRDRARCSPTLAHHGCARRRIFQEGRAEWEEESHRMHELWKHDHKGWLKASKTIWRDLRTKRSEE